MDMLSQLKHAALWVVGAILTLSLLVNYKLFGYTSQLKASNLVLGETITSQEATNYLLAGRITDLTALRAKAQQDADEMARKGSGARTRLKNRIEQLEQELKDETCSTEPVAYPADWVSGY